MFMVSVPGRSLLGVSEDSGMVSLKVDDVWLSVPQAKC